MQKVDMVIALVGVIAIVVTAIGVVIYDEVAGNEEIKFESVEEDGFWTGGTAAPRSAGAEIPFSFEVPDNATAADFQVTITFRGSSGQGSTIPVSAYFTDPTGNGTTPGNNSDPDSGQIVVPANNQAGGQSVTLDLSHMWGSLPAASNTTNPDEAAAEATTSYDGKLITVYVTIGAHNDAFAGVIPGISYVYDIEISGDLTRYQRDVPAVPDPIGGQ